MSVHRSHLPHQRFGPPGAVIFNPATVLRRVVANAKRDKRVNNIFMAEGMSWVERGRRLKKGGRKNYLTRG
jgi:hypothetical protein